VNIPYGFDAERPHWDNDPWVNLKTINEFMEDQQPIPSELARWLGEAIRHSCGDPNEFMKRLGLKHGRGRPHHRHSPDAWAEWGERIWQLEQTIGREAALASAAQEYANMHGEEPVRATLQGWRTTYENARAAK